MSTESPRRHTLTDAYNDAQAVIERLTARRASQPSVSVELTRNAKGETQIGVKVSTEGETDEQALADLVALTYREAYEVYDLAAARYPNGSGFVRNDGDAGK
jgi:hypothetical protein